MNQLFLAYYNIFAIFLCEFRGKRPVANGDTQDYVFQFQDVWFQDSYPFPRDYCPQYQIETRYRGTVALENWDKQYFHILFDFEGSDHIVPNQYSFLQIGKEAEIKLKGKSNFAKGFSLRCD